MKAVNSPPVVAGRPSTKADAPVVVEVRPSAGNVDRPTQTVSHQPAVNERPSPNPLRQWIAEGEEAARQRLAALARERMRQEQERARFAAD